MDTLRCRAYTRQRVRQQCEEVGNLEERVMEAHQKILAINNENKRYCTSCTNILYGLLTFIAYFSQHCNPDAAKGLKW